MARRRGRPAHPASRWRPPAALGQRQPPRAARGERRRADRPPPPDRCRPVLGPDSAA